MPWLHSTASDRVIFLGCFNGTFISNQMAIAYLPPSHLMNQMLDVIPQRLVRVVLLRALRFPPTVTPVTI